MSLYSETPWTAVEDAYGITVVTNTGREVYRVTAQWPIGPVPMSETRMREARRAAIFICLAVGANEPSLRWGQVDARTQMGWLRAAGLPVELSGMRWRWLSEKEMAAIRRAMDEEMTLAIDKLEREGRKDVH